MPVRSFKELEIWQRGVDLVEKIYKITKPFPTEVMALLDELDQISRMTMSLTKKLS